MKKRPYFFHLILLNLMFFLVYTESRINNLFIILVILLFVNLVYYQYKVDSKSTVFDKAKYRKLYNLERITSINAIVTCIILIIVAFSDYTVNKSLAIFTSSFAILHLTLFTSFHKISDMLFNHIDDEVIHEVDEDALKRASNKTVIPYYLAILLLVGYGYFVRQITDIAAILLLVLSIATLPFFVKGPSKAKNSVRVEKKYIYDSLRLPLQVSEPTTYSMFVFLAMFGLSALLYFVDNHEYLLNLVIIAVISLHTMYFDEFGVVVSYYLKEDYIEKEEQDEKKVV